MAASGESILSTVRRASEASGVEIATADLFLRLKLERAIEAEITSADTCNCCGGLDWEDDE